METIGRHQRCAWAGHDPVMLSYHDTEWGVPCRDSRELWETLMLDGFQAGLSWRTILNKRDAFRKAFKGFDPGKVARFGERDIERLLLNEGIVRSRAKIEATIAGAKIYLAMERAGESFAEIVWSFVGGVPIESREARVAVKSIESEALSKALKARGFKFVGPVIVYAWMQAVGMVNDHEPTCFRRAAIRRLAKP